MNNEETYPCVKCGKDATEDYLVPNVGMVCDDCMTDADFMAWHRQNAVDNPDSYSKADLAKLGLLEKWELEDVDNLGVD